MSNPRIVQSLYDGTPSRAGIYRYNAVLPKAPEGDLMVSNLSVQINSAERVIEILEKERLEVMELRRYLMRVRVVLKGQLAPRIQELLDGLVLGMTHCCDLLAVRVNSLCYDSLIGPPPSLPWEYRWKISAGEVTHCRELLLSIQLAYAHCARTTAESMSAIASLGDAESSAILRWVWSSTKEALWFIEIYLEGLAVGMDCRALPEWKRTDKSGKHLTAAGN